VASKIAWKVSSHVSNPFLLFSKILIVVGIALIVYFLALAVLLLVPPL